MEIFIIFITLEIIFYVVSFVYANGSLTTNIIIFISFTLIASPILTMMIFDYYIHIIKKTKNYKKIIKLSIIKYKFTINDKRKNSILLDLAPFYFMIDDNIRAEKTLKQIDFLQYKSSNLKAYHQLLMAYNNYVKQNFIIIPEYIKSAINYAPMFENITELLNIAIELKNNKNKELIKRELAEKFSKLPNEIDDFYIEPFDKLYKEVDKNLKIS